MPESEPASIPESALAKSSWWRRLFHPKDIGFYLMIALAWIGAIYTTYDLNNSRWYWSWLIPVFGLICVLTQWKHVEPTSKDRMLLVVRQIMHWGAVSALAFLVYMLSSGHSNVIDLIDDRQGSFIMTLILALSTYLAGVYYDWRLCVVAAFILAGGIINVAFSNLAPLLMWIGFGVAIIYFVGVWLYNHWREKHPPNLKPESEHHP
jgi:hypothetical protein